MRLAAVCTKALLMTTVPGFWLFSPSKADAATIDVPTDQATIQAAIDTAVAGDTVRIASGVFHENLSVTKAITLVGAGAHRTILQPAISNPEPCTDSSLCNGAASSVITVRASDVTVRQLTVDGDNPSLTSGVIVNGADIDARNGIVEDYLTGAIYNDLEVADVVVKNVFFRGIYASSGGTFQFDHNRVLNVAGSSDAIALFNFGGAGEMSRNTVRQSATALSANHSTGTRFFDNTVVGSSGGIHTDNAGDAGGSADSIERNRIIDCAANGFGAWVFAPYLPPVVERNFVEKCTVGLALFGGGAPGVTQFRENLVDGANASGSIGAFVTTDQIGFGTGDASASFERNWIVRNDTGLLVEQPGSTVTVEARANRIAHQTSAGLVNTSPTLVDATCNDWGSPNGPINPSNPDGDGNAVIGNVTFVPFLSSFSERKIRACLRKTVGAKSF